MYFGDTQISFLKDTHSSKIYVPYRLNNVIQISNIQGSLIRLVSQTSDFHCLQTRCGIFDVFTTQQSAVSLKETNR